MAVSANNGVESLEFSQIERPGAYVLVQSGQLMRVPPDALAHGRSPMISICGEKPLLVCPVSSDPWIAIGRARSIAAGLGLKVKF